MRKNQILAIFLMVIPVVMWLGSLIGLTGSCCGYLAEIFFTYQHRSELLVIFVTLELSLMLYVFGLKVPAHLGLDGVLVSLAFSFFINLSQPGMLKIDAIYSALLFILITLLSISHKNEEINFWRTLYLPVLGGGVASYYFLRFG